MINQDNEEIKLNTSESIDGTETTSKLYTTTLFIQLTEHYS